MISQSTWQTIEALPFDRGNCGSANAGLEKLRAFGNVTALDSMTPEELKEQIKNFDALIIRSASKVGPYAAFFTAIIGTGSLPTRKNISHMCSGSLLSYRSLSGIDRLLDNCRICKQMAIVPVLIGTHECSFHWHQNPGASSNADMISE